jgi:hypothetical protein
MRRCCIVALPVLLLGCNTAQKKCEHARDVFVEMAERDAKAALATVVTDNLAELEKEAKADVDKLRGTFVEHCLALGDEGKKCIERIDELRQAELDYEKQTEACPKDDLGFPDEACQTKARDATTAKTGACDGELKALMHKVYGE